MVKVVYPSILCDDTVRKLSAIGIEKMSDYVNEIEAAPDAVKLLFKDKLEMIIDRLYQNKINDTIKRLRSRAKLSEPDACTQSIVYDNNRNLSRYAVLELATCGFMNYGTNVVIEGVTGSGKTYLACAIANVAIEKCYKTLYVRLPDLIQEFEERGAMHLSKTVLYKKYARPTLLIIDEWLLQPTTESFCNCLLEIFERRKGLSTVMCTLYEQSEWHNRLGGNVQAESVIDRIVHNCVDIVLGDLNMRAYTSPTKMK